MGEVFRARDRASGEAVAVKVLLDRRSGEDRRFAREATVLSELRHPGIVRYVAHGLTDAGEPYLAMEWLDGEDLSCRLRRGALPVNETLTLLKRVSEALAAAHARGVVHRDFKPSNLFLVDGDVARVKVLDFGIAHLRGATTLTKTGMVLGTPGYMAPEQASGKQEIDARTDVFALGCVLFECLTGAPLFTGEHVMAVLAKILFQEAPRVSERRPDVPPAFDALVASMLTKQPDQRPSDGAAVARALAAGDAGVPLPAEGGLLPTGACTSALTGSERRVVSVMLLDNGPPADSSAPTLGLEEFLSWQEGLRQAAAAYGGRTDLLADGSVMVTISQSAQIATDQAAQAARCALALRAIAGDRRLALATGRAEMASKFPVGEVIDRAARMLKNLTPETRRPSSLAIDEVTAGLLDARFNVVETEAGLELHGEHEVAEGARTLLGKVTACVGRDWELSTLDALLTECIEDSRARAVLVTAPVGMGKSRVAYEFVRRVRQHREGVALWSGRIDSLQAGSTFGLLAQVLQSALGIRHGERIEVRREKLRVRVLQHVAVNEHRRVTEFLGELVGTPFSDDASAPLRAARGDAQLMGDQMKLAFLDFLRAETSACPVLIVLEDLHWGDLPTVRFIDAALRDLRSQPWMVLALARPEVHDLFPKLWADRAMQEIRLKELSRRASEHLVRQALGDDVAAETAERIVTQAEGHAFYLEELIRAAAEGKGEALPETVLSMVESRLAELQGEGRRVLRAASVFGEVFWAGGVAALLGDALLHRSVAVDGWLSTLVEREMIVRRSENRFSGEQEFAFRHALLREGAYAMLTEPDRELGHRLAGGWLEQRGETDPIVLAEHFERGKDMSRAANAYLHAAEQALQGNDLGATLERAERGIACGASLAIAGTLRLVQAKAHLWRGDMALAERRGSEAVELLEPGSSDWFTAFTQMIYAACRLGEFDRVERWMVTVADTAASEGTRRARCTCLCAGATAMAIGGRVAAADALIAIVERAGADPSTFDIEVLAHLHQARVFRATTVGDPGACLKGLQAALAAFEQADDRRNACMMRVNLGYYYGELGDYGGAEATLRTALVDAERMGLQNAAATAQANLGQVLGYLGQVAKAREMEESAVATLQQLGDPRIQGAARCYLAKIFLLADDPILAECEAQSAAEDLLAAPRLRALAVAVLARALLCQGRVGEALAAAREMSTLLSSLGAMEAGESLVRLTYAEVLYAAGVFERARAAIAEARDRLLANAAKIGDPKYRKSFLENVPENVRILALAQEWLGGDPTTREASFRKC